MKTNVSALPLNSWQEQEFADQKKLHTHYTSVLGDPRESDRISENTSYLAEIRNIEDQWNAEEEERVAERARPETSDQFLPWYRDLCLEVDRGMDPFYNYLAEDASLFGLAYYFSLEQMIDGHFDDTIALAQLGLGGRAKLALARNYWDEMGRGRLRQTHTFLFDENLKFMNQVLKNHKIAAHDVINTPALKNSNLFAMWALRRRYSLRLLGGLGLLEDTAGYRFGKVIRACKRLQVPKSAMAYAIEHAHVDPKHGEEWLRDVVTPLINHSQNCLDEVVTGILIRHAVAQDYANMTHVLVRRFEEEINR